MLEDFNPDCDLQIQAGIFGLASLEYKIVGAGYGELINLLYKAITLGFQQDIIDRIISDFKSEKEAA